MSLRERWHRAWQWLNPTSCSLCAADTLGMLCVACEQSLPWLTTACPCCAGSQDAIGESLLCGRCQFRTPSFDAACALFRYATPIDRLIQGMKYGDRLDWASLLGDRLTERVAPMVKNIDGVLPVPLHNARLRERGYNQSLELARPLMKQWRLPLVSGVVRTRATAPQTSLAGEQREHNMRDAFATERDLSGKRLAIVDDVMTSGATADALAHCLRAAGASHIEVWVIARA